MVNNNNIYYLLIRLSVCSPTWILVLGGVRVEVAAKPVLQLHKPPLQASHLQTYNVEIKPLGLLTALDEIRGMIWTVHYLVSRIGQN